MLKIPTPGTIPCPHGRNGQCHIAHENLSVYLQSNEPVEDVLPHAQLHIKLCQLFICLCARLADIFTRRYELGEIQDVPGRWHKQVYL